MVIRWYNRNLRDTAVACHCVKESTAIMEILVDYNNVADADRRKGIRYITERVLAAIGPDKIGSRRRVTFRLYDGWFEMQSPSRVAQAVSADVQTNAPHTAVLLDGAEKKKVTVNVELAFSLRSEPTVHLWHTFRQKAKHGNFTCTPPASAGCVIAGCPLQPIAGFFSNKQCPQPTCTITPEDVFTRNEQKLVDTMIAADLFSLFMSSAPEAVLVSSDDDHLPIVRLLVNTGMTIFHVLTRPKSHSMGLYLRGLDPNKYLQFQM